MDPIHHDLDTVQRALADTSQLRDDNHRLIRPCSDNITRLQTEQAINLEPHLKSQFHPARAHTE